MPLLLPTPHQPPREVPLRRLGPPDQVTSLRVFDPVAQSYPGPLLAGTLGLNFDGQAEDGWVPPDANGSVGQTQYVQWVNTTFEIYDKANGASIYGPAAGSTLWQGFGGQCASNNSGDPIAKYDRFANRWVMMQPVFTPPYYICVAVSATADATGSYYRYAFPMTYFPDYPKLSVWITQGSTSIGGYFITSNSFSGNSFAGANVFVLNRTPMLTGAAATYWDGQLPSYGGCAECGSLLASDIDGPTLPSYGTPNYIFNLGAQHQIGRFQCYVDFSKNPIYASFSQQSALTPATYQETCSAYSNRVCVAQLNTVEVLDSLSTRMMYRAAYRKFSDHESIVMSHSVQGTTGQQDDYSAVRWYELRIPTAYNPTIYQQGSFEPDTNYRWMGSAAMDEMGDILVGFSLSSNIYFPRIYITGRTPSDPSGTMESELNVVEGTGSQTSTYRWGDYDSMAVDPVDDCTFWYTNEYLNSGGSWQTRIATFKFSSCP